MPKGPLSHTDNRSKVCISCFQKCSSMSSTDGEKILSRIRTSYISNYDPEDAQLPRAVCTRCRNLLLKIEKGERDPQELREPFDFSKIVLPPPPTRLNPQPEYTCSCAMCQVARGNPVNLGIGKSYTFPPFPLGRPSDPVASTSAECLPSPRPIFVCKRCWQPVGKGIKHP
ncbi:hypothetical protein SNE40_019927 [Patella caerulea]|uniref:Uncharacterized protein n=1 Tax=Patella caerulea TaxID=87958 RepID=A0AAN8G2V7_PATCE